MDNSICGCLSSDLSLCTYTKSSTCICPAHPSYGALAGDRTDICCITQNTSTLVKPLCLTGEKSVCKSSSKGCCFSSRCAYPCDKDVVPGCGTCFLRCCKCGPFKCEPGCCVAKGALPPDAFGGYAVEVAEPKKGEEYIITGLGCCLTSLYVPATYADAFGTEAKGVWCCFETDTKMSMLPKKIDGYEVFVDNIADIKCIKPSTCCKGTVRSFFVLTKCAFPCDSEVPFSIICCGFKLCGGNAEGFKDPAFKQYLFKPIEPAVDKPGAPVKGEEMDR